LRVLHIITGLGNGGAEKTLVRLITSETKNSHVVISLMNLGFYGERLRKLGYKVETLNMNPAQVRFGALFSLLQLIKEIKPDVIQTWMYHADLLGGLIGRLAGVRFIYWGVRGPYDKSLTPLSTKIVVKMCSWISNIVPLAIVSNSQHAIDAHIAIGYTKSRFVLIRNGYEAQIYAPGYSKAKIRGQLNLDKEKILFGMVARYDPYKDHETLLIAFSGLTKLVQNVCLVLVGPRMDNSNKALLQLVKLYGLEQFVRLLGPREDIPRIMKSLDIHVLSSVSESFPNVLAEAMAAGTPCITTDVGDAAIIVGEVGWVVPPSSPQALKNAMVAALDTMQNDHDWNGLKNSCRERVFNEFSQEKMTDSYLKLWSKADRG
jgi:glycosyltransferase involved in cell wall biosynthesis